MIELLLLLVAGAVVGAAINWAIYQWAICQHRPISPWMKARPELVREQADAEKLKQLSPRSRADFIPVVGWFRLKRDEAILGKGCWVRPLLIELSWMIGLPIFFFWNQSGSLIGLEPGTLVTDDANLFPDLATTWFWVHAILIALMFVATFIDFDEQMIPDQVTVPGTVIALVIAALIPASRLPLQSFGPAGTIVDHIDFSSPGKIGDWYLGSKGLLTCLAIYCVWVWGLLPKVIPLREFGLGIFGSCKMIMASIVRPARAGSCDVRIKQRSMFGLTRFYLLMLIVGLVAIVASWFFLSPLQKLSFVSSFIGLAVSGGLIWGIRIVGGFALGQQAMGFGDVTLMCMIGAFLGWQAGLAAFVYSIGFAVVMAIILFIITRKSYLAFGPYLCMGALLAILRWPETWTSFGQPVFWWGPWLLVWLLVSLVMMAVMLPMVRWLRETALGGE